MCIVCRDRSAKRTLTRIVRSPDGVVRVDPTGKLNGRGAYLCDDVACWSRALAGDGLEKALKTTIDESTKNELRAFAERSLTASADASRTAREGIRNE
jgi:predicted RNA-binding protein YlxR (DUF448 family)